MKNWLKNLLLNQEPKFVIVRSIFIMLDISIIILSLDVLYFRRYPDFNLSVYYILIYWWLVVHNMLIRNFFMTYKFRIYVPLAAASLFLWGNLTHQFVKEYNTYLGTFIALGLFSVVGAAIYLAYRYLIDRSILYQLDSQKRNLELAQLKTQLNPHFLFNALNNIYSYNLENDKKGNDLILKLSQLMRYIVEVNNKPFVTLSEEIQFTSNYVSLEKERLGYRCDIEFKVQCVNTDVKVAPLLFFPLIENAFKHGAATNKKSHIEISLIQDTDCLEVTIINSISEKEKNNSTNVGITNVKRRLELLHSGRHSLHMEEKDNRFSASLKIKLP